MNATHKPDRDVPKTATDRASMWNLRVRDITLLAIGAVLGVLADISLRPIIAEMLPGPKVTLTIIAVNSDITSHPCTQYEISVEPKSADKIKTLDLQLEFLQGVSDYAWAGTSHTVSAGQIIGENVVGANVDGCYFLQATRAEPPNITAKLLPSPTNKFMLSAAGLRERIAATFIAPASSALSDVSASGDFEYENVGVPIRRKIEVVRKELRP